MGFGLSSNTETSLFSGALLVSDLSTVDPASLQPEVNKAKVKETRTHFFDILKPN
jgi:hypothetical protein